MPAGKAREKAEEVATVSFYAPVEALRPTLVDQIDTKFTCLSAMK
jgi:hypothetical protein